MILLPSRPRFLPAGSSAIPPRPTPGRRWTSATIYRLAVYDIVAGNYPILINLSSSVCSEAPAHTRPTPAWSWARITGGRCWPAMPGSRRLQRLDDLHVQRGSSCPSRPPFLPAVSSATPPRPTPGRRWTVPPSTAWRYTTLWRATTRSSLTSAVQSAPGAPVHTRPTPAWSWAKITSGKCWPAMSWGSAITAVG